jgi:integrase
MYAGLRRGELTALRIEDWTFPPGRFTSTEAGRTEGEIATKGRALPRSVRGKGR